MDWTSADLCDPLGYMISAFLTGLGKARFRRVCRAWLSWCGPLPKGIDARWEQGKYCVKYIDPAPVERRDVRGNWRTLAPEANSLALHQISLDAGDFPLLQELTLTFDCLQLPISGSAPRLHSLRVHESFGSKEQTWDVSSELSHLFRGLEMPSLKHVCIVDAWDRPVRDIQDLVDMLCTKCPGLTSLSLPRDTGGYSIEPGRIAPGLRGFANLRNLGLVIEVSAVPKLSHLLKECARLESLALYIFSSSQRVAVDEPGAGFQPVTLPAIRTLRLRGGVRCPFQLRFLFDVVKLPNMTQLILDVDLEWTFPNVGAAGTTIFPPRFNAVPWLAYLTHAKMSVTTLAGLKLEMPSVHLSTLRFFDLTFPRVCNAQDYIHVFVWLIRAAPSLVELNLRLVSKWRMEHLQRIRDAWSEPEARTVIIGDVPWDVSSHQVANPRALLRMFTFDNGRDFWSEPVYEEEPLGPELRLFE